MDHLGPIFDQFGDVGGIGAGSVDISCFQNVFCEFTPPQNDARSLYSPKGAHKLGSPQIKLYLRYKCIGRFTLPWRQARSCSGLQGTACTFAPRGRRGTRLMDVRIDRRGIAAQDTIEAFKFTNLIITSSNMRLNLLQSMGLYRVGRSERRGVEIEGFPSGLSN